MRLFCIIGVLLSFILVIIIFDQNYMVRATENVFKRGDVDDTEVQLAQKLLDIAPSYFQEKFSDDGWRLCVTDNIDNENNIIGKTFVNTKRVYVKSGAVLLATFHELGHMYLDEHPYDKDDEFIDIYNREGKALSDAYFGESEVYNYSNPTEYFCSAFDVVYLMGEDELGVAPDTFRYMKKVINSLS